MDVNPQRKLRTESGELLRRAEAGEQFVITLNGRPVATLGPCLPGSRETAGPMEPTNALPLVAVLIHASMK